MDNSTIEAGCPEKAARLAKQREYYAKNKDKFQGYYQKSKDKVKARKRRNKYGITAEEYDAMLAAQNGCCAICGSSTPKTQRDWHVDHCHTTGRVRGILCHGCNTGLGGFADNIEAMQKAIDYMRKHSN